jgi:hypothetical protein
MKTRYTIIICMLLCTLQAAAQAPLAFNYQAVARNAAGAPLTNQNISLRLTIRDNSAIGPIVYQETQNGISTNQFGLFTTQIGGGSAVSGTFAGIDWANGAKYLKVEFDPNNGTAYLDMGTTQLLSVPYALYAEQSGSGGAQPVSVADLTDVNLTGLSNNQVLVWNGTSWVPTTISGSGVAQTLSINGNNLSISNGNSVTLPAESQSLSINGNNLSISGGNTVALPAGASYTAGSGINISGNQISAVDNSTTNEIQTLSLAGSTLSLSNGGGSVTLPSGGGGVTGNGSNNYVARFTPNGTTLGNSILQDDGTYIGLNAAPNGTDRMYLNAGSSQTGGLKINYTNTANGSYALNGTGTNGNSYLNYTGSATFGTLSATNPLVYGASAAGSSPGILGATSGTNTSAAVVGLSNNWHGGFFASNDTQGGVGLYGFYTGAASSAAIIGNYSGTVDTAIAVYGYNARATGQSNLGVVGQYNGAAYGAGVAGVGFGGGVPLNAVDYGVWGSSSAFAVYADGDFTCTGAKNASVPTSKGNQLVYSIESPEVWFEDFGRGKLENGVCRIELDPLFLETVVIDDEHPMIVTVTPEGNCNGLYVEPGDNFFMVKELANGQSGVKFSYRITCKRTNYQDHRFGSDPTWGDGDTRKDHAYVQPKSIDFNTAKAAYELKKKLEQNKTRKGVARKTIIGIENPSITKR